MGKQRKPEKGTVKINGATIKLVEPGKFVRVVFDDGSTELVDRRYLVDAVERIGHPDAESFREKLLPAREARQP